MTILEGREAWSDAYAAWEASARQTGERDWKQYPRARNSPLPETPGVDLSRAKLLLISSAGGYDPATQDAFEAADPFGDYGLRELPFDADPSALAYAHEHYDHAARQADAGVLLPHALLRERRDAGTIGAIAPVWLSFMGYQPDLGRVVDELCTRAVEVALREQADAALLVPS
jgi:hypothetical protein